MKCYAMTFDGALLERGFWLYVWRITHESRCVLYVGRTGDSSSPHASSPFKRIVQHLDPRPSAKANALGRHLKRLGLPIEDSTFEMVAVGPIFPEQEDMARHRVFRDQAAALECALAEYLRAAGYEVVGVHPRAGACDSTLYEEICRIVDQRIALREEGRGNGRAR